MSDPFDQFNVGPDWHGLQHIVRFASFTGSRSRSSSSRSRSCSPCRDTCQDREPNARYAPWVGVAHEFLYSCRDHRSNLSDMMQARCTLDARKPRLVSKRMVVQWSGHRKMAYRLQMPEQRMWQCCHSFPFSPQGSRSGASPRDGWTVRSRSSAERDDGARLGWAGRCFFDGTPCSTRSSPTPTPSRELNRPSKPNQTLTRAASPASAYTPASPSPPASAPPPASASPPHPRQSSAPGRYAAKFSLDGRDGRAGARVQLSQKLVRKSKLDWFGLPDESSPRWAVG